MSFFFHSRHQKGSNPLFTTSTVLSLSLPSWWGLQEDSFPPTNIVSLILLLMTSSCQTAFTPSTRIPLFTFQHPFSLSLQSGERHRSRVIFPDCQISNFHFFFSFRLRNRSWYPKTTYFFPFFLYSRFYL